MAEQLAPTLSAKEAVSAAFKVFDEFFDETEASVVLLEGVDFVEDRNQWAITIGFDIGVTKSSSIPMLAATFEPRREKRTIHINADTGEFVRMT